MVLYLPFGALGGFVQVALTFLATKHGLSITEGALLNGANMGTQWLKWLWAPAVDVTLSPRKWYVLSTAASAVGVFTMSVIPLGPGTLGLLLFVIASASLINSIVGMAVEALISGATPPDQVGRVSAWFQAGNLGGTGLGGALGLYLVTRLPGWLAGSIMGALFMICCGALLLAPQAPRQHHATPGAAVKAVIKDLRAMLFTKGGVLSALLCVLPIGTGAAQTVLAQAEVAAYWGAKEREVELMQGLTSGFVTSIGCFVGGWICQRIHPRTAYALIGVLMAVVTATMAVSPAKVAFYVAFSLLYALVIGLAYSAFTAFVLVAMGEGSGATKYNIFASLSNFPIWWLGLLLGRLADGTKGGGPPTMLLGEAAAGVIGVVAFVVSLGLVRRSRLAEA
jgi:MFS family permease